MPGLKRIYRWSLLLVPAMILASAPAATVAAATTAITVTEDSVGPAVLAAGANATATLTVHSSANVAVDEIGVAVRDANGNDVDFPGDGPATITPAGYTFTSSAKSFTAGTYTIFGAYEIGGVWTNFAAGTLTIPSDTTTTVPSETRPPTTGPEGISGTWSLKFNDAFSGTSVDTTKWNTDWFGGSGPVDSSETACYSPSHVTESGGSLNLLLTASSTCGYANTGALVNTFGHFDFTYGVVQAHVYIPASSSAMANWPAVWTDGEGTWPTTGEDDIMEGLGGTACANFHYGTSSAAIQDGPVCAGSLTGWHTFASDWEPGSVTYYYDGAQVAQYTQGITSTPQYAILDYTTASGDAIVLPATMMVNSVQVYQH
jgi:hypothetical protein